MRQNLEIFLRQMKAERAQHQERLDDIVSGRRLPFHRPDGRANMQELEDEREDAAFIVAHLDQVIAEVTKTLDRS